MYVYIIIHINITLEHTHPILVSTYHQMVCYLMVSGVSRI
jgi:hypothetical protein